MFSLPNCTKPQTLILKCKNKATCRTFNKQKIYLVIYHPTENTGIPFAYFFLNLLWLWLFFRYWTIFKKKKAIYSFHLNYFNLLLFHYRYVPWFAHVLESCDWRMLSLFSALRTHNQGFPISMLYCGSVFLKILYSHPWQFINSRSKYIQGEKELTKFFYNKIRFYKFQFQLILIIIVQHVLACLPDQHQTAAGLTPVSEGCRCVPAWSGSHTS